MKQSNIQTSLAWNGIKTDIDSDAWWRNKVISDFSVFHWLFTYDIPADLWLKFDDWVENLASTRIISTDWQWHIKSWWTLWNSWFLRSKRHPRYQPNRWHLFSTSAFLSIPTATWIRQIWLKNTIAWVYFQLENGVLYAIILDKGLEKRKEEIAWITINDLQYWNLYDIQFQWRGVWDYFFYINQKLVHTISFLWTQTETTISNPAISALFYCENTDWTEVEIKIGCVDITSEWGKREWAQYSSVANATTKAVTTANYPVLIAHSKDLLNWVPNTRDSLALRVNWSSDQKSFIKAYVTRDLTAMTWASFNDVKVWSWIEFDVVATAIDIAKCQLLWSRRIELDWNTEVSLPSNFIDFYLTWGDYLIITIERENPTQTANVIASLEMWEEI